jgi:transcriptional regulator with XRE-family HTH domain
MGESLSDHLRRIVNQASMSRYAISKRTGIPQSVLSRFVNGERGLSLESIDKLAEVLGLEIRVKPGAKQRRETEDGIGIPEDDHPALAAGGGDHREE